LGAPWVAFALVLWPLTFLAMYRAVGASPSSAWADLTEPPLDTGPLWFLPVLLLYSLGYAAWSQLGARLPWAPGQRGRHAGASPGRLRGRHLAAVAVGIATASFVVRLWFPLGSAQVATSSRGSGRSSWRCSGSASSVPGEAGSRRCRTGCAGAAAWPRWPPRCRSPYWSWSPARSGCRPTWSCSWAAGAGRGGPRPSRGGGGAPPPHFGC